MFLKCLKFESLKTYLTNKKDHGPKLLFSVRFLMAILAFFAFLVQYMFKSMVSVAIVCMVNNTWLLTHDASTKNSTQFNNNSSILIQYQNENCYFKTQFNSTDGPFKWSKHTQGLILASMFWGYILTQIPAAWLSFRYGAKLVLLISFVISSGVTLLLPLAAHANVGLFIFLRVVNGATLGVLFPCMASFFSQWSPPTERSLLLGIADSGSQIGNAVSLSLASFLCLRGFSEGWGSIYYIYGIIGIFWCFFWLLLSSDSPSTHKFISDKERNYIVEATKETAASHIEHGSLKEAPWKEIMTSIPCISFFITMFCNYWGIYTFLTNIPTYMKEILHFDIKASGGLAAIPYLLFWLFTIISGAVADRLFVNGILNRSTIRKISNGISNFVPMTTVIGLIFINCTSPYAGLALLCVGLAFTGVGYGSGFVVNANDIAGNYAGIVFGIGNTFASIPGIVAPNVVGALTSHSLQSEWRNVFIITAVLYFIGGLQSIIFTSGELQYWAKHTPTQRKSLKKQYQENNNAIALHIERNDSNNLPENGKSSDCAIIESINCLNKAKTTKANIFNKLNSEKKNEFYNPDINAEVIKQNSNILNINNNNK